MVRNGRGKKGQRRVWRVGRDTQQRQLGPAARRCTTASLRPNAVMAADSPSMQHAQSSHTISSPSACGAIRRCSSCPHRCSRGLGFRSPGSPLPTSTLATLNPKSFKLVLPSHVAAHLWRRRCSLLSQTDGQHPLRKPIDALIALHPLCTKRMPTRLPPEGWLAGKAASHACTLRAEAVPCSL